MSNESQPCDSMHKSIKTVRYIDTLLIAAHRSKHARTRNVMYKILTSYCSVYQTLKLVGCVLYPIDSDVI